MGDASKVKHKTDGSGKFAKGNASGGRPKGSVDRVKAVMDAVLLKYKQLSGKAGGEHPQKAVAAYLASLDDKTLAMLYSKTIPKDLNMNVDIEAGAASVLKALIAKSNGL